MEYIWQQQQQQQQQQHHNDNNCSTIASTSLDPSSIDPSVTGAPAGSSDSGYYSPQDDLVGLTSCTTITLPTVEGASFSSVGDTCPTIGDMATTAHLSRLTDLSVATADAGDPHGSRPPLALMMDQFALSPIRYDSPMGRSLNLDQGPPSDGGQTFLMLDSVNGQSGGVFGRIAHSPSPNLMVPMLGPSPVTGSAGGLPAPHNSYLSNVLDSSLSGIAPSFIESASSCVQVPSTSMCVMPGPGPPGQFLDLTGDRGSASGAFQHPPTHYSNGFIVHHSQGPRFGGRPPPPGFMASPAASTDLQYMSYSPRFRPGVGVPFMSPGGGHHPGAPPNFMYASPQQGGPPPFGGGLPPMMVGGPPPGGGFFGPGGQFIPGAQVGPFPPNGIGYFRSRGTPCFPPPIHSGQLDQRIQEMNRRLAHRQDISDSDQISFYDRVVSDFFDDDAVLIISFLDTDGPKKFSIGRTLISRFFRTMSEGGVVDVNYIIRNSREQVQQQFNSVVLDSDVTMVTQHMVPNPSVAPKPLHLTVLSDARLSVEFSLEDLRIRKWNFVIQTAQEFINKVHLPHDPSVLQELVGKSHTRQGMSSVTVNYLKLCVILEPMSELMSRHKAYPQMQPRECLKNTLFQKYRQMQPQPISQPVMLPPDGKDGSSTTTTATGRKKGRKRKQSNSGQGTPTPSGGGKKKNSLASPAAPLLPQPFTAAQVDVMVVGEPSLMGGEFGEEDERQITRLENTQYDPTFCQQQAVYGPPGGPGGGLHMAGMMGGGMPPGMLQAKLELESPGGGNNSLGLSAMQSQLGSLHSSYMHPPNSTMAAAVCRNTPPSGKNTPSGMNTLSGSRPHSQSNPGVPGGPGGGTFASGSPLSGGSHGSNSAIVPPCMVNPSTPLGSSLDSSVPPPERKNSSPSARKTPTSAASTPGSGGGANSFTL